MNKSLFTILLLLLNVATFGQTPDYQKNGWKEWYFSNGNVACKIYSMGEDGVFALHLVPEAEVCISGRLTSVGWRCMGTEGNYDVYKLWEYEYHVKCERQGFANFVTSIWYEWLRPFRNSEKVLKIAKDWSKIVYPEHNLSWYNHVHLNRVSPQAYKATVRAQKEALARAQAKYGGGNYGNGGSTSSSGGYSSGNSSGSSSSVYSKCRICNGSGRCTSCRGTGTGMYTYGGTSHSTCSSCNGSGRCFNCYGTGRI